MLRWLQFQWVTAISIGFNSKFRSTSDHPAWPHTFSIIAIVNFYFYIYIWHHWRPPCLTSHFQHRRDCQTFCLNSPIASSLPNHFHRHHEKHEPSCVIRIHWQISKNHFKSVFLSVAVLSHLCLESPQRVPPPPHK